MKSLLAMVLAAGLSTAFVSLPTEALVPAPTTPAAAGAHDVVHAASFDREIVSTDLTDLLGTFIGPSVADAIAETLRTCLSTVLQAPAEGGSIGPQA